MYACDSPQIKRNLKNNVIIHKKVHIAFASHLLERTDSLSTSDEFSRGSLDSVHWLSKDSPARPDRESKRSALRLGGRPRLRLPNVSDIEKILISRDLNILDSNISSFQAFVSSSKQKNGSHFPLRVKAALYFWALRPFQNHFCFFVYHFHPHFMVCLRVRSSNLEWMGLSFRPPV